MRGWEHEALAGQPVASIQRQSLTSIAFTQLPLALPVARIITMLGSPQQSLQSALTSQHESGCMMQSRCDQRILWILWM